MHVLKQLGGRGGEANWLNKATPPTPVSQKTDEQKRSRFTKQNNNFAPASQVLVHFFAITVRGLPREIALFHVSRRT